MKPEEKEVMEKLKTALPLMTDFEKGYVLGLVDARRKEKEQQKKAEYKPA